MDALVLLPGVGTTDQRRLARVDGTSSKLDREERGREAAGLVFVDGEPGLRRHCDEGPRVHLRKWVSSEGRGVRGYRGCLG